MISVSKEIAGEDVDGNFFAAMPRKQRTIRRNGLRRIGEIWWRRILPRHFTPAGAHAYGYARRGRTYMLRKAKKYHHQNPLEWTGASKRSALREQRITATFKDATVRVRVERYWNYQPSMRKELTAVTAEEAEALARHFEKRVGRDLMARSGRRRVKKVA